MYLRVTPSEKDVEPATVPAKRDPWALNDSARPTDHQRSVLDRVWRELSIGDHCVHLLTGYAGTGKTFSLALLLKRLEQSRGLDSVVVAAPTHKAARQLERAMRLAGVSDLQVVTVARLLGLKEVRNYQTGETTFEQDSYATTLITTDVELVIIDEISMVSERCVSYLREALEDPQPPKKADQWEQLRPSSGVIRVLAVGDPHQLPPVEDGKLSSLITCPDVAFRLEEVVRHDGAILDLATATRELGAGRPKVQPADGDGSSIRVIRSRQEWLAAWLDDLEVAQQTADPDLVRALCWTNARKDDLNHQARARLFGEDAPPFVVGEQLLTADAIADPTPGSKSVLLHSTTDLVVLSAEPADIELSGDSELGIESLWSCWHLRVATREGQEQEFYTLAEGNQLTRFQGCQNRIARAAKDFGKAGKEEDRKAMWRLFFKRRDHFGKVQNAAAITIHKSQGSTFQSAYVDLSDIDRCHSKPSDHNRLSYTAFTRAAKNLITLGA
jgi:exodeoxyribonuclease-5